MYAFSKIKNEDISLAKLSFYCFFCILFWGREEVYKESTFCALMKIMKKMDDDELDFD